MKYLAALSLAMAPLAMAKAIRNVYPVEARNGHLQRLGGGNGVAVEASNTQIIIVWVNPGNNAQTTTINQAVTVTQTVTAGAAETTVGTATISAGATTTVAGTGATHTVQVGGSAGLAYSPSEIQAAVGDMVIFTFMSQNHTVTQSSFAAPCDPLEGGLDSNFQPNKDNAVVPAPQVAMQVMNTDPVWFYCKQTGHCGKGMVFSINPTAAKTQALFQAMAIAQKGQGAGSAITGNATSSAIASDAATSVASATSVAGATETASAGGSIQTGTGQIVAGACVCAVTCAAGSFPDASVQGVGHFGGVSGSLPANLVEVF
ncbi:Cupredoxin [Xylaria sp. FL1777]|nr:Cupredoxin [Xylaria sp. FL1777]